MNLQMSLCHKFNRQYRQTTTNRVTFRTNTSTQPFSTQYYASTTPVTAYAPRYWRGTKPVVNFHLGSNTCTGEYFHVTDVQYLTSTDV